MNRLEEMEKAYNERMKNVTDMIFVANCNELEIPIDEGAKVHISGTIRRYRFINIDYEAVNYEIKQMAADFKEYLAGV